MMQHSVRQSSQNPRAGITELVLAEQSPLQSSAVLPMLAHLSRQAQGRWFTWILPQGQMAQLSRDELLTSGFDLSRLRLIHTKSPEETWWVLWQALAQGNSEAVVASPGRLTDKDFAKFEQAAYMGNTQGLLIRYR